MSRQAERIRKLDARYLNPGVGPVEPLVWDHALGSVITDADGREYIDLASGTLITNLGHAHPRVVAAVAEAAARSLAFYNCSHAGRAELARRLAELTPGDLERSAFFSSGSEAVDAAVRLARLHTGRTEIVSFAGAFHGRSFTSLSVSGLGRLRQGFGPGLPGVIHAPYPDGSVTSDDGLDAVRDVLAAESGGDVAAILAEPYQGAGGVIIPPAGYWKKVEGICRKHGILLISDEVICGFGRLGRWFGFQHFGIKPDIVSMAKGLSSGYLPISATAVSASIADTLKQKGGEFVHGYTYSGHPTAAAVALKNLQMMAEERLVERVAEDIGPYFAAALSRIEAHPLIGEARSLGLIGALEIVSRKGTNQRFGGKEGTAGPLVRDACISNGLMVRAIRDTIVMCPPLVITHAEVDRLADIIERSLTEAESKLREIPAAA